MACNVETVLLSAMSIRPDCSTGTAKRAALELRDLDVEPLVLEEALLLGDHGGQRLRERQQAEPDLLLRGRRRRSRENAEQDQQRAHDASNDSHGALHLFHMPA